MTNEIDHLLKIIVDINAGKLMQRWDPSACLAQDQPLKQMASEPSLIALML